MLVAFFAALLAAGVPPPVAKAAEGGIQYSPMFVYFKLVPGETATQSFKITNYSRRAVRLTVAHRDAWHDEQGARTFPESGSAARGLGKWLSPLKSDHLRIAAGAGADLQQAVTVPEGVRPGTYLGAIMVGLESYVTDLGEEESADRITAGARVKSAVALLVHVDVKRPDGALPAPELSVAGREVTPPTDTTPLVVKLRLLNKSDWEVRPIGTLAVFDAKGQPAGKAAFDKVAIWPGQPAWLSATFTERLKPGSYHALAAFSLQDPGNEAVIYPGPPVKQKLDIEVTPSLAVPPPVRGLEGKVNKQGM